MNEIVFVIEDAPEGGFQAHAFGESLFTQAGSVAELHANIRDAVHCHFDADRAPRLIRLDTLSGSPEWRVMGRCEFIRTGGMWRANKFAPTGKPSLGVQDYPLSARPASHP